jgi:hypothetical protein
MARFHVLQEGGVQIRGLTDDHSRPRRSRESSKASTKHAFL